MVARALAVLAAAMLVSCQGSGAGAVRTPGVASPAATEQGVITGGVVPCAGIVQPTGPHYAAATVVVLRGPVNADGSLPASVVAQQTVGVNASYRFVLDPGQYVLVAHFPPPANILPRIGVTLTPGESLEVDIPNECF